MNLHELTPSTRKSRKRLGRGNGSGLGKTSGRGHKGQRARSGGRVSATFEGGQMPLFRRLPIRGFNNARFKTHYNLINVGALNGLEGVTELDANFFFENGIFKKDLPLKVLGTGELNKAFKIKAQKFTRSAIEKIKSAGGEAIITGR